MKLPHPVNDEESPGLPGHFDRGEAEDPWFLPPDPNDMEETIALPSAKKGASLVDVSGWRAGEAALAGELTELAFDFGRLAERVEVAGQGAVRRLALEEAAALGWWTGDRVGADRLALWTSYRIGAAQEDGGGLIRTAWAARRLAVPGAQERGPAALIAATLDEHGRADQELIADVAAELDPLAGCSAVTRGAALFHLWRSLDERPDHLRDLEAVVLGARMAGQGALPFLPLARTGIGALTASGSSEERLASWVRGAQRAVLAALMAMDRMARWRAKAEAATADLSGRTPARLIAALATHPMLAAPQAETETGASRAAVQRNLDVLQSRDLIREVTGQGRFRVWAARL